MTPISQLGRLNTDQLAYNEFDTVGVVVCTCSDHVMSHDQEGAERHLDVVFVSDSEGSLLVLRLWDGLKVRSPIWMNYIFVHFTVEFADDIVLVALNQALPLLARN